MERDNYDIRTHTHIKIKEKKNCFLFDVSSTYYDYESNKTISIVFNDYYQ